MRHHLLFRSFFPLFFLFLFLALAVTSSVFVFYRYLSGRTDREYTEGIYVHAERSLLAHERIFSLLDPSQQTLGQVFRMDVNGASRFHISVFLPPLDEEFDSYRIWLSDEASTPDLFAGSLSWREGDLWVANFSLSQPFSFTELFIVQESLIGAYSPGEPLARASLLPEPSSVLLQPHDTQLSSPSDEIFLDDVPPEDLPAPLPILESEPAPGTAAEPLPSPEASSESTPLAEPTTEPASDETPETPSFSENPSPEDLSTDIAP